MLRCTRSWAKRKTIVADTELEKRQLEFCDELLKTYPRISAAAIGGNATEENRCLPITRGPKDHGSDGSLQWREGRLVELQTWPHWDTLPVQAQFAIHECQRDYPELHKQLLDPGTRTLENLTANFMEVFERPAPATNRLDLRIKYAHDIFNLLEKSAPIVQAPITPIPEVQTVPIAAIVQILVQLAPAIEAVVAGIVGGVAKAHGASVPGASALPIQPGIQIPQIDFAALAKQLAEELAQLQAPKS